MGAQNDQWKLISSSFLCVDMLHKIIEFLYNLLFMKYKAADICDY